MHNKCLFSTLALSLCLGNANAMTSFELHNINEAHKNFTGKGITIGVADTTFDKEHPLLKNQFVDIFNNTYSGTKAYHGNHVAGIAAANQTDKANYGVAYESKIVGFGNFGRTVTDEQANKALGYGVKIINNSHTGSPVALQKISKEKNVLMIFSAGNDGNIAAGKQNGIGSKGKSSYGEYYDIGAWLVVGNVNQEEVTRNADGSLKMTGKAVGGDHPYSNLCDGAQGYCVFAAGTRILSADSKTGTEQHSGTSMSAPAVTGIAALVSQKYSFLDGKQLADVILSTSNNNIDMPDVIYKKSYNEGVYYVIYISDKEGDDKIPREASDPTKYDKKKILEDLKKVYGDSVQEAYLNNTYFTTMTKEQIFGQGIVDAEKALKGLALLDVNRLSTKDLEGNTVYYTVDTQGQDAEFSNDIDQRKYDAKYHQDKNLRKTLDGKDAGFKKTGDGTLSLAGNLNYLGDTIVEKGGIALTGTSGTTKTVKGGLQVKTGATLSVDAESNIAKNLANAGTTTISKKTEIGQDLSNQTGGTLNINAETTVKQSFSNAGLANVNAITSANTLNNQTGGTLNIKKSTTITAGNFKNDGAVTTSDTLTITTGNFENAGNATLNAETKIVAGNFSNSGTVDFKGKTTVAKTLSNAGTLNVNAETTAKDFSNAGNAGIQAKTTVSQTLTNAGLLNVNAETSANTLDNSGTANIQSKTTTQSLNNQENGVLNIGNAPVATRSARLLQSRNATSTALLNVGQSLNNAGTLNVNAETTAANLSNTGITNILATTNITNNFENLGKGTANIAAQTTAQNFNNSGFADIFAQTNIADTFKNAGISNIAAATQTKNLNNTGVINIKSKTTITNDLENQVGGILNIGETTTTNTATPSAITARSASFRNNTALATVGNNLNNYGTTNINAKTSVTNNLNNQTGGTLNINAETSAKNLTNSGTTNIDATTDITGDLDNKGTLKVGISTPQTVTVGGKYSQGDGATLQLAFLVDDSTNSKLTAANYDITGGNLSYAPLSASVADRSIDFDLGTLGAQLGNFKNISLNSNGYALNYRLTQTGITVNARPNIYADFDGANPRLASVLRSMSSASVSADYTTFFATLNAADFSTYRTVLVDLNDLSHLQYNNLLLGIQNQDILEKIVNLQTDAEGVFLRPRYAHLKAGLKAHRAGFEFYANKNTTLGGLSAFINYDNLSGSDVSSQLVSFGTGLRNTTATPLGIFGGIRLGFANNTIKKTQQLKYKTRSASLFAGIDKDFAVGTAHLIPTFYIDYHYFHQEKFHHAGISYRGTAFFNSLQQTSATYAGNNLFARNVHAKNSNFVSANLGLTFKQNLADFWNLGIHGFYERRLLGDKFKSTARFTDFGNDFEQTLKLSQNFFRLGFDLNYESPINANGIGYFASVGVDYEISEGGADKYRAYGADLKGGLKF